MTPSPPVSVDRGLQQAAALRSTTDLYSSAETIREWRVIAADPPWNIQKKTPTCAGRQAIQIPKTLYERRSSVDAPAEIGLIRLISILVT
jgi:hypothetical protein